MTGFENEPFETHCASNTWERKLSLRQVSHATEKARKMEPSNSHRCVGNKGTGRGAWVFRPLCDLAVYWETQQHHVSVYRLLSGKDDV